MSGSLLFSKRMILTVSVSSASGTARIRRSGLVCRVDALTRGRSASSYRHEPFTGEPTGRREEPSVIVGIGMIFGKLGAGLR
jgi:hypothetical protein